MISLFIMIRRIFIFIFAIACSLNISAKDELLYSYQAKQVMFIPHSIKALLDSIVRYEKDINCSCEGDSTVYNVSFIKTSDWPLNRRVVVEVYGDRLQNYLCKEWKYVSYFEREGKKYRINVAICCEDDVDWLITAESIFLATTDSITLKKFRRSYTDEEIRMLYEHKCMLEEDGGTEIYFVYEDGELMYWRGYFCDGSIPNLNAQADLQ